MTTFTLPPTLRHLPLIWDPFLEFFNLHPPLHTLFLFSSSLDSLNIKSIKSNQWDLLFIWAGKFAFVPPLFCRIFCTRYFFVLFTLHRPIFFLTCVLPVCFFKRHCLWRLVAVSITIYERLSLNHYVITSMTHFYTMIPGQISVRICSPSYLPTSQKNVLYVPINDCVLIDL